MIKKDIDSTRLARVETRLSRLCVALGIDPQGKNLRDRPKPTIYLLPDYRVRISHLDVSFLDIRQYLTANHADPGVYVVYHDDVVVGEVDL